MSTASAKSTTATLPSTAHTRSTWTASSTIRCTFPYTLFRSSLTPNQLLATPLRLRILQRQHQRPLQHDQIRRKRLLRSDTTRQLHRKPRQSPFCLVCPTPSHPLPTITLTNASNSYTSDYSQAKNVLSYIFLSDGIPIVYAGEEQHYSGGKVPYNREATWLSGYDTSAELYTWIATTNAIRKLAISADSAYITYAVRPSLPPTLQTPPHTNNIPIMK